MYFIGGKVAVDYFIRFESLLEGVEEVCHRVSVPFDADELPHFKKGMRPYGVPLRAYYDTEAENLVKKVYGWELEAFSYRLE